MAQGLLVGKAQLAQHAGLLVGNGFGRGMERHILAEQAVKHRAFRACERLQQGSADQMGLGR